MGKLFRSFKYFKIFDEKTKGTSKVYNVVEKGFNRTNSGFLDIRLCVLRQVSKSFVKVRKEKEFYTKMRSRLMLKFCT